ncbi:hypothetical protein ABNM12_11405 [Pseudomonas syringae]|uniref:hypothetical protein n=1 Tax=Pseudomonas syringae TaxID=317 RepID=UPI0032D8B81F
MQAQHIIILVGIGVCFLLLTVFIERAIKRAILSSYLAGESAGIVESSARIDALNAGITILARNREGLLLTIEFKRHLEKQLSSVSTGSLTKADLQVMSDTAITLGVAYKTWVHIKGTELWRTRATIQLEHLNAIVLRILGEIRSSEHSLDTSTYAGRAE